MEKSRVKNSIKNMKTGMIMQLVNKLMMFVVRTVFIKMLNTEYLGVNGLFTNILTMLSFAELGIGTAIIFNMYKPVAENDKEKIKGLMNLYKKSYNIIGISVFLLGILVIPFLNVLVKDVPNIKESINVIYILFLLNTSISYFYTYKKSIITAYQQESVTNNISSIFYLLKSILEIIFLIITKNYIVYLVISIIVTLLQNIVISIKAEKMFPFLKEKDVKSLPANETKAILQNVKSLVVYKFGAIVMFGTDDIIMSAMLNVATVGLCSNYTMIIKSVKSIIISALNGVTASVGNLNAGDDKKKKEDIFYQMTFANYIVFSFCAVAFIILLNPFVEIWLGKEYILELSISIALSLSFFIEGLREPSYTYRTTLGLFEKGKTTPYIAAFTNIIFSILFCKLWGVVGIFIATSIAQLVSYSWIDPYLIHKYGFETSVHKYFRKVAKYISVFFISVIISVLVANFVKCGGITALILKACIVLVVPNVINIIIFNKSEEFMELKKKVLNPIILKIEKKLKTVK